MSTKRSIRLSVTEDTYAALDRYAKTIDAPLAKAAEFFMACGLALADIGAGPFTEEPS
jgi:hypothetical protein